jgi:hypothetical protein
VPLAAFRISLVPTLASPNVGRYLLHMESAILCGAIAGQQAGTPTIVVARDTTEIEFAGREERRSVLGPPGDGVSAGFFIHPLIAIDGETEAVPSLLDASIWGSHGRDSRRPKRRWQLIPAYSSGRASIATPVRISG